MKGDVPLFSVNVLAVLAIIVYVAAIVLVLWKMTEGDPLGAVFGIAVMLGCMEVLDRVAPA